MSPRTQTHLMYDYLDVICPSFYSPNMKSDAAVGLRKTLTFECSSISTTTTFSRTSKPIDALHLDYLHTIVDSFILKFLAYPMRTRYNYCVLRSLTVASIHHFVLIAPS